MQNQIIKLEDKGSVAYDDTHIVVSSKDYKSTEKLLALRNQKGKAFESIITIPIADIIKISYSDNSEDGSITFHYKNKENQEIGESLTLASMQERGELAYQIAHLKGFSREKKAVSNEEKQIMLYIQLGGVLLATLAIITHIYLNVSGYLKGIKTGRNNLILKYSLLIYKLLGLYGSIGLGTFIIVIILFLVFNNFNTPSYTIIYTYNLN